MRVLKELRVLKGLLVQPQVQLVPQVIQVHKVLQEDHKGLKVRQVQLLVFKVLKELLVRQQVLKDP